VLVCLNALVLAALGHAQPQHYVAKFLADVTPFEKPYSPGGSSPIGIRRFTNSGTIVFGYGTAFYHGGQLKLASTAFGPGQQVVDANSSDEFGLSQISSFKFNTYASGIKGQVKNVYNNTGPTYLTLEYSCLSEDGSAGGYANGPYNAHSGFGIISNLRSKRDLIVSETCSIDQVLSEHSYVKTTATVFQARLQHKPFLTMCLNQTLHQLPQTTCAQMDLMLLPIRIMEMV
jgi:hypothetical protein